MCAGKFQLQIDMSASSLKQNLDEVTEEINHLLHCARIETFELNEDKIVSNHISSDNANLLVDGINHRWHRPF